MDISSTIYDTALSNWTIDLASKDHNNDVVISHNALTGWEISAVTRFRVEPLVSVIWQDVNMAALL